MLEFNCQLSLSKQYIKKKSCKKVYFVVSAFVSAKGMYINLLPKGGGGGWWGGGGGG